MRTALLLLVVLCAAPADVAAQTERKIPENQIAWWTGTYKKALQAAEDRNVPVVVVMFQDGEEANERLASGVLRDPKFVKACDGCIPIICSKKDHGNTQQKTSLGKRSVCSKFGEVPCELHVIHEGHVFREFFAGKAVKTPQIKFCTPDLDVVEEIVDVAGTASYIDAIRKVKKKIGPGLDRLAYEDAKVEVTRGRNLVKQHKYKEAWDACAKTVAVGGESRLVKDAREIHAAVTRHVETVLKTAFSAAESKDMWSAIPALEEVSVEFKGTDLGRRATDAYRRLAKTKEGRPVVRALKKQKKYLPLLKKAQTYEGKNDFVKARDAYRRILDKAKGLPIAKKAEARLAIYDADPEIKALLAAVDREREASDLLKEAKKADKEGRTADAEKLRDRILKDFAGTRAARRVKDAR